MRGTSLSKYIKLGERLRAARLNANKTQRELALEIGIPYTTYSNYENGNREPNVEMLKRISSALDISFGELIGWPDDIANAVAVGYPTDYVKFDSKGRPQFYYYLSDEQHKKLNTAFYKLNTAGQSEAVKRVEELTEIPRYQKKPDADQSDDQ